MGIAFDQPAPPIEEMDTPSLHPVSERGAPRSERGNLVGLAIEAIDLGRSGASTGTWQVQQLPNLRRALQQLDHVRIICGQEYITLVAEPMDDPDQRGHA